MNDIDRLNGQVSHLQHELHVLGETKNRMMRDLQALRRMGDIHHARLQRLEAFMAPEMDAAGVEQTDEVQPVLFSALKNESNITPLYLPDDHVSDATILDHLFLEHKDEVDRRDVKNCAPGGFPALSALHNLLHTTNSAGH